MKFILNLNDFIINEELKKLPATYKFSKKDKDIEHNRLASKKKDGHAWKKESGSSKKYGKTSMIQTYNCECGAKKVVTKDEDKGVSVEYKSAK